jgi:hypothetical protein
MRRTISLIVFILTVAWAIPSSADEGEGAAEMARKLQDPLANIAALMTDNDVNFNTGNDETSYGFQLQPVYAVPLEKAGFNLVNRAVIPILGMAPQAQKPIVGEPLPPGDDRTWGLSDSVLQFFFSPRNDSAWKWGAGPMFSLKTRTDDKLAGPGWGGGPIAVLVGNFSESVSAAFIGGHLWGEQDGFSMSMLQPMIFYNLSNAWNVHYNNMITYDWNATSGNE